jgi:uncharacterized protein DUF4331
MNTKMKTLTLASGVALLTCSLSVGMIKAADHGDGPLVSVGRSEDIGDIYAFLDPNDNTRLVLVLTTQGFIVPGEAVNFSVFDHQLSYGINFETTGDATPDQRIRIRFSRKRDAASNPQTATIRLPNGTSFEAPTTVSDLSDTSPTPVITTDPATGVMFFAGEIDDPFFFDIPGFNRFVASVLAGSADPTLLQRGRDTFAGYNTLGIALSLPASLFGTVANNVIGIHARTARLDTRRQLDRQGVPAVNVALVPFPRKDAYNRASTEDDANGVFADDIIGTLQALGTNQDGINLLALVAVTRGDFLRLDLTVPNTGADGGVNPEAAFPNGRRLGDDVIDTILNVVTNGTITTGDNVNSNERNLRDAFPFVARTHQPFAPGTLDDRTRN